MTISRLLPMLEIFSLTFSCMPRPRDTMAITAPTPIMMPSMVRKVRILLASMPSKAIFTHSLNNDLASSLFLFCQPTIPHHQDPLGHGRQFRFMGDHDHRFPFLVQFLEDIDDF